MSDENKFTVLYVNLNGEWAPDECQPEYLEISRWPGIEPIAVGDLVTIHGSGDGMVTARISARRWGVRRGGEGVTSLELYGDLTRFDGGEGDFFPNDVRRIVRTELAAAGNDHELIEDMIAYTRGLKA